jgi:hypothetical protein
MNNLYSNYNQPPKIATHFLSWALPKNLVEPVLGDLSEEYLQRISKNQLIGANYWYWRQAVKSGIQFMLKTQRGFVMFIFSVLLFLGFTFVAMVLAGGADMYMDLASILLIFPPAIAFTYASTSINEVNKAFSFLLGSDASQNAQVYRSSKRVFLVLGNAGVLLGIFMTLIGWVAMGSNMDDMNHFGSAFAVSVLTLIYGIGLKMLCYVAEQKIQTLSES